VKAQGSSSQVRMNSAQKLRKSVASAEEPQNNRPKIPAAFEIKVTKPKKYTKPLEKFIYDNIMIKHNVPGI